MRRFGRLYATRGLLACVLGLLLGCGECGEPESPRDSVADQGSVEVSDAREGEDKERLREAFGVPLPPEYESVDLFDAYAKVWTKLSLDEVRSFYESRLVDFETVREGSQKIYFYGLHEHQPDITARQRASRFNTEILIRPKPERDPPAVSASGFRRTDDGRVEPPEKGTPDETTLPSGEKFAPGARWGEPYTPPAGSPLADPRFKSNWGKPYGEWVHQ